MLWQLSGVAMNLLSLPEYGIQEDRLTQLSRIKALSVISRASVMEYRGTTKNLRQVVHELRVANVLEGAVQHAGGRVRINVQLIDTTNYRKKPAFKEFVNTHLMAYWRQNGFPPQCRATGDADFACD